MDKYFFNPQQFSFGGELASLIATCGILPNAWEAIRSFPDNKEENFLLKKDGDVVYLIFPSFLEEHFVRSDGRYGEYNIQSDEIFSTSFRSGDTKPALVKKESLNRFRHILENSDFKAKIRGLKESTIIFVGHSIGGAVAALATLWFLQMPQFRKFNIFCITFGAPLVGNATIQEAVKREDWLDRFCHVVSKYDIVPRMYLAPYKSIAEPLVAIVPHWQSKMGIGCVSPRSFSEACMTLLNNVLMCTSTIANRYTIESGISSPYVPFGTYMFCSNHGAICVEDSEAVRKLLHFSMQSQEGIPLDQIAQSCISEHTDYGHMFKAVNEAFLNARQFTNFVSNSSFEVGIALELEAIGIGAQDNHAFLALRKAGELKNEHDININNLHMELSKNQRYMAELEWYKRNCTSSGLGYYDAFRESSDKVSYHAQLARKQLAIFWDCIVEMEEKHALPSDFRTGSKWISAGTSYRRLVEPLDIAEYYRKTKGNESYLSVGVRPHRHIVLEKWMKEKEQTRIGGQRKGRMKFPALTEDSCFWARLEETCKVVTSFEKKRQRYQVMISMKESLEFEIYVEGLIRDKSISVEVFLEHSSFMKWWQQYSQIQLQSPQWRSSSLLFNFMANESWKQS